MSNLKDTPQDQAGRVAIVTGANSGIGFETARNLACRGARVVMACRSQTRGQAAADRIREESPPGEVELELLDLSKLASVRSFAARFAERFDRLDLLINNAGVMAPPKTKTEDGFELQLATNHLGHFALTGLLLPMLLATTGSRVVVLASHMHRLAALDLDDLNFEHRIYSRWLAYGQSKLANLLFAQELHRRLSSAGATTIAVSAHPGWAATELQRNVGVTTIFNPLLAQDGRAGARPTLHAATAAEVHGGDYFGPRGFLGLTGRPTRARSNRRARDSTLARKLWERSEDLTGVRYEALSPDPGR
jgi:NAD(P)-dependent dehydrogenase (short-subunit alcohol dehydrogenase family)